MAGTPDTENLGPNSSRVPASLFLGDGCEKRNILRDAQRGGLGVMAWAAGVGVFSPP